MKQLKEGGDEIERGNDIESDDSDDKNEAEATQKSSRSHRVDSGDIPPEKEISGICLA